MLSINRYYRLAAIEKSDKQRTKNTQRIAAFLAGNFKTKAAMTAALVSVVLINPAEGGCWEQQLCCTGKNVTCKASGPRMNDVDTGKRSRVCFCDEYCLRLKDCCTDYTDTCKGK